MEKDIRECQVSEDDLEDRAKWSRNIRKADPTLLYGIYSMEEREMHQSGECIFRKSKILAENAIINYPLKIKINCF